MANNVAFGIDNTSNAVGIAGINYDDIITRFGASKIDKTLIDKFEQITGKKAHYLLKRGIFFSHRDLDIILTKHEKKNHFSYIPDEVLHRNHYTSATIYNLYLQNGYKKYSMYR